MKQNDIFKNLKGEIIKIFKHPDLNMIGRLGIIIEFRHTHALCLVGLKKIRLFHEEFTIYSISGSTDHYYIP